MSAPLVLLVEDELPMRRFLRTTLTAQAFRLVEATTAHEALTLMSQYSPELVLLDLGLPDADGLDVTRQLRSWSRVPIIVLSARGASRTRSPRSTPAPTTTSPSPSAWPSCWRGCA
jgi:two-component system KDP operon response regulator KdpE